MLKSYAWQGSEITYRINGDINFDHEAIRAAARLWNFTGLRIVEADPASPTADLYFVDFDQAVAAFGNPYPAPTVVEFVVDAIDDDDPSRQTGSYGALDAARLPAGVTQEWLASHVIGHMLGLEDRPAADPAATLMSYRQTADPSPRGDDFAALQGRYGASPAADTIAGSVGADTILGGHGADLLFGDDGSDLLYGNLEADTLSGGAGVDRLYGGQGGDDLSGGQGADLIYGNLEGDRLFGGAGADTLYGGQGADWLEGGDGLDVLFGNLGADTIVAGPGDTIVGLGDDDVVIGSGYVVVDSLI